MKPTRVIAACVLSASPFAMAAEVQKGDSLADVRNALGVPRGHAKVDGRQVLYYERGEVELVGDTVTRVALRSPEEQLVLDASEEHNRGERVARQNQLLVEGTALRDLKMADAHFTDSPLVYQISYWENFTRSYPGVSVVEPLTIARLRLNEQLDARRQQDEQAARISDLEERLAQAESGGDYYPFYGASSYYGYRRYHGPAYPPNFGTIRYDFAATTAAPYETPHGSPYTTPHGSPYTTPTTIDFNYYYKPAPAPRNDDWNGQANYRHPGKPSDYGRDKMASRDRRSGRSRY